MVSFGASRYIAGAATPIPGPVIRSRRSVPKIGTIPAPSRRQRVLAPSRETGGS